jgi:hypothetical protein
VRACLPILGCLVLAVLASRPVDAQSHSDVESPASSSSKNLLCTKGRVICISKSVTHSLLTNPFKIDVHVYFSDDIEVAWEVRDNTGQILESSSTYDQALPRQSPPESTLHIRDFIFTPARSQQGTLTLSPSRFTVQTGKVDLPGIQIPVKLTTVKSFVTTLIPADPHKLESAVITWVESEHHPEFNPQLKLVPRRVEVMQFGQDAIIGVTAEAVLRSSPGQSPWHVIGWHRDASTAHVTVAGSGWAGVTYYLTGVDYLIKKSVLNLPGIKSVVFNRPE